MSIPVQDGLGEHPYSGQSQQALEEFLTVDLELALTFLETCTIEMSNDRTRVDSALEKARAALSTVKRFLPRVEDPVRRSLIAARSAEVDACLRKVLNAIGR